MIARLRQPTRRVDKGQWNSKQDDDCAKAYKPQCQAPEEVVQSWALSSVPTLTNVAFPPQHSVEQDKPHHAADVSHHDHENETGNDDGRNQSRQQRRINLRKTERPLAPMLGGAEIGG